MGDLKSALILERNVPTQVGRRSVPSAGQVENYTDEVNNASPLRENKKAQPQRIKP